MLLRRRFLQTLPAGLIAARSASAAEATITIAPGETSATVHPFLHGHFIEHLGGVIYDGVWVGEGSKIGNYQGVRKALVDAMRDLGPTTMRWPGGCFADSYDWRDGIGPSNTRPRRTNFWTDSGLLRKLDQNHPAKQDPNTFGTLEFIRFCRLIEAEPYFAANLRSLPAQALVEWIDYCNSPRGATTLAERRAAHGSPDPLNVHYWGVGNESWGCGGEMTGDEYSVEFRKFISWAPRYSQTPLRFIPAGPNGFDYQWTRTFFGRIAEKSPGLFNRIWGFALHYYCGTSGRGNSMDFTPEEYYDLLVRADRMDELISRHWALMGEHDKEHKVKLVIDEWGAWHRDSTAVAPHHLFGSVPTMRDAVIAGLTMDTFHRHAGKISMANVAQLVNCIQTLFLAHEDRFCLTPTYHVFRMYRDHHNGQTVKAEFQAPSQTVKTNNLARIAGSATRKDKTVTVTFVNTSMDQPLATELRLAGGASATAATAQVLAGSNAQAANTFGAPEAVKPRALEARLAGGAVQLTAPAASVVKVTLTLA